MPYSPDLQQYSLQQFKKGLEKREMIPSRIGLKKDIDRRFSTLDSNGIKTLKDLIDQLKTKTKIESFSKITGLSIEYLTILKREAGSYLPKPIPLNKFGHIIPEIIDALEQKGIKNTKQLFTSSNGISGIPSDILSELSSLSDLTRLYGVGPVFAKILYDAGISSVDSFSSFTGKDLISFYENKTGKKADFGENEINFSIELAKELLSN